MGMSRAVASAPRCLAVCGTAGVLAGGLVALVLPELRAASVATQDGSWRAADLQTLLGWLAALAVGAAGAWLTTVTWVVALGAARGRVRVRVPGCPAVLRRCVLSACGAAVTGAAVGGLLSPAHAGDSSIPVPAGAPGVASLGDVGRSGEGRADRSPDLHGLPMPDRAPSEPHPGRPSVGGAPQGPGAPGAPTPPASPVHGVVVEPGDSLWAIAEDALQAEGRGTEAVAVDRRWRALHAHNRDRLGPDPDLILPGQQLRLSPGSGVPNRHGRPHEE